MMSSLNIVKLLLNHLNEGIERINSLSNSIQEIDFLIEQSRLKDSLNDLNESLQDSVDRAQNVLFDIIERKSLILSIDAHSAIECEENLPEFNGQESEHLQISQFQTKKLQELFNDYYHEMKLTESYKKTVTAMLSKVTTKNLENHNYYKNKRLFLEEELNHVFRQNENIMKNLNRLHTVISQSGDDFAKNHFVYDPIQN